MSDRNNLQRWQAASHPELAERKPEELFEPEFAERYKRLHNDLWQRMVRLHGTIHALETMADFPFDYLYGPNDMEFWRLVGQNFVEMTFVLLHGLVNDKGGDAHTLFKFRDQIVKLTWLDARMRELFIQTLRDNKFDSRAESVVKRIKPIRDHIAHRLRDKQTGDLEDQLVGVSLRELKQLFVAGHSLFGALSFGSAYVTLSGDLMPGTIGGKPTRTCLDGVLDAVIRNSELVNRPERESQWWQGIRKHMPPEELRTMNKLRKRVGLRDA